MEFFRRIKLLAFSFFLILSYSAMAQHCETYPYSLKYPPNNLFNNRVAESARTARDTFKNEVIIIPVVIHVLYNSGTQNITDAQIQSQLQSLNNDFRKLNADAVKVPNAFADAAGDARIIFCLAKVDGFGKATTGIIRKYTSTQSWLADDGMKYSAQGGDNAWDAKRYLNIWVCNLFGRSLGYSSLPGSQADRDGVVIQYNSFGTTGTVTAPFNKGRTLSHETGHWLGLKHLWGDANCGDDGIADTPPQQTFNNGCPSFPHKTICSKNDDGDMFMNFMDFTDDACMNMFSKGQVTKMRSIFTIGGARNSFLNSTVCDANSIQGGPLPPSQGLAIVGVTLYPSPATDFINIESNIATDVVGKRIKITNVYGGILMAQTLSIQKTKIDIAKLPSGTYFLKLGEGRKTIKFIKQ